VVDVCGWKGERSSNKIWLVYTILLSLVVLAFLLQILDCFVPWDTWWRRNVDG
jgi:hypothetical protein